MIIRYVPICLCVMLHAFYICSRHLERKVYVMRIFRLKGKRFWHTVMWIRIYCIRIHKIWQIRIRSRSRWKIKLLIFKCNPKSKRLALIRRMSDLKKIISCEKNMLVELCFSFNFMPLDPDPHHCWHNNTERQGEYDDITMTLILIYWVSQK